MTEHKQKHLEIINNLPLEQGFHIPAGLPIPIGDRLLIKPVMQKNNRTESGLIIPQSSSRRSEYMGIVMLLGDEVTLPVFPGLKVEFELGAYHPTNNPQGELVHKGIIYVTMSQHLIRAIIPPDVFKYPVYETNEEKRRQMRIDETKQAKEYFDKKQDQINNNS